MEKLIKHVAMAHSGVYTYLRSEVSSLGLCLDDMPIAYTSMEHFNVYRPAAVLAKAAPLYTRLPVTVEHPNSAVTSRNSKALMEGFTGDTAEAVYRDGEVYIDSTLTLIADEAIKYYEEGYNQVSPGYTTKSKWLPTQKMYKGMPYQIVVTDIPEVNHLALCQTARGGPTTRVLDSIGGNMAKFKSGLFHSIGKLLGGTKDSVSVRDSLALLTKEGTTEEQVVLTVDAVILKASALPDSEGREKLTRFLEDLKLSKTFDAALVADAVAKTADLYEVLDNAAEEDASTKDYTPGTTGAAGAGSQKMIEDETAAEESAELVILKQILAALTGTNDSKKAEEEKAAAEKATKDAMDAEAAKKKEEDDKKAAEEKKTTTDSITATLGGSSNTGAGSIDDLMNGFKK